jgi:hypothetical protein
MALNTITKLRLPNGEEVAFVDWTDKPLFSTIEILHGTTTQEMNFFQYVQGDSVPAFAPVAIAGQRSANDWDTNLAAPGSMASTEEMLVYAIRPEIYRRRVFSAAQPNFAAPRAIEASELSEPFPTATMLGILSLRTLLSLEISKKVFSQASFGYFNTGFGVVQSSFAEQETATGLQGQAQQTAVRSLTIPQHIGGQEKFRVFLTNVDDGTEGNPGLELGLSAGGQEDEVVPKVFARIKVNLDGLYKRPVS